MQWVRNVTTGSGSSKAVLVCLCDNHHSKNNSCYASMESLVSFTELNWKTIKKALAWLEEAGFITTKSASGVAPNYILNMDITSSKIGGGSKAGNSGNLSKGTPSKFGEGEKDKTPSKFGEGVLGVTPSKFSTDPLQIWHGPPPNLEDKQVNRLNSKPKTSCRTSKNEPYQKAAQAMWEKIRPITGEKLEPNFDVWAKHIRLTVEVDKRSPEEIWAVFKWANQDPFWQSNILSPAKLRKQFGALVAKKNLEANRESSGRKTGANQNPGRLSAVERVKQARFGNRA